MKIRHIVSFGAGVNTGAMLTILRLKKIPIDECIYADTKTNWDSEYKWIENEAKPYLEKEGIKFTTVTAQMETSEGKGSLYGFCMDRKIIPPASRRECTDKFKIKPIMDYIKRTYPDDLCFVYIGYDADEPIRAKKLLDWKEKNTKTGRDNFKRLPYVPVYPLLQYNIGRERCKELIKALGLRVPEKSRCYICPFMKEEGFKQLYEQEPHNYEKALILEENNSRFEDTKCKTPWCLLANRRKQLRKLRQKFQSQTRLVRYLPIPHLMLEYKPQKPKVEGSPRLDIKIEGRTSIPPTIKMAGILEVIL